MKKVSLIFAILIFAATASMAQLKPEDPLKVTLCQLKENPPLYNHRLVEVTGFVANVFEGRTLFDPNCSDWPSPWWTFSAAPEVIENIRITPVKDARYLEFEHTLKLRAQSIMRATLVGRFFSGKKVVWPKAEFYGGFGHFGCCTLFAIQQVIAVDQSRSPELDYLGVVDQPNIAKAGCGYSALVDREDPTKEFIKIQTDAEQSQKDWIFTDPKRVAVNGLAQLLSVDQDKIALTQTRQGPGRFVYKWRPAGKKETYMVVVSRPYWLSFYAADPKRVAWLMVGAFEESCSRRTSVTRIR